MSVMVVGAARQSDDGAEDFRFAVGEVVLVKWEDGKLYYAKLKRIDRRTKKCGIVFEDNSRGEANFGQIHSVNETTTEIVCIVCKGESSEAPNEIVLCDKCAVGYHQLCHHPPIPDTALKEDEPWECTYCYRSQTNPHVSEANPFLERPPPPPKKRRLLSVSASRQSRTQRGTSPKQVLGQGNSSPLCIKRTLPSGVVVHGRSVVAQSGSPPGLSSRSDQASKESLQKPVGIDTLNSHENEHNLAMSPVMSSPTVKTSIGNFISSNQTAVVRSNPPTCSVAMDGDVTLGTSHSDAQSCEREVQSLSLNSQKQLEGATEVGQQQTCLSNEAKVSGLSSERPPAKKNVQSKGTGLAAAKHRFGGSHGKIRRPGSRGSTAFPRTRTPNRTTGRISVWMQHRLQKTGSLKTTGSSSLSLKSSPIMASRAPPVLPRIKSDCMNDLEVNQQEHEETEISSARKHSVCDTSPTKVQGSQLSPSIDKRSPVKVASSNTMPAQPVSSFVTVKREPHSPSSWDSVPVKQDELCDEKVKEPEEAVHKAASQLNLSLSTEVNSQESEGSVVTDDAQGGEETAKLSSLSMKALRQIGSELSDDPCSSSRCVVRATSVWRPQPPLTLQMLQRMSQEKVMPNVSPSKTSQPLPKVPALSKNKTSVGDQSGTDVIMQSNKIPTERSSGLPGDVVKVKPTGIPSPKPTGTLSPKPWDAELRVFASSAGQLDSHAEYEKIRQQVAETKRRREAQEKSSKGNSAKTPRIGTGNSVSLSATGSKASSSFTSKHDEEHSGLAGTAKTVQKRSPAKLSQEARSVGRGIIEYSSKELQEKTLQQLFADVNRRMQSGSWMGSVDTKNVELTTDDNCVRDPQPQISIGEGSDVPRRAGSEATSNETSTSSSPSQKFSQISTTPSTYDIKFAQMDETALMNQFDLSFGNFRIPEARRKPFIKAQTNPQSSSPVSSPVLAPVSVPRTTQATPQTPSGPTSVHSPSQPHRGMHTRTSGTYAASREIHGATRPSTQAAHVPHPQHILHQHQQTLQHQHQHQHHSQLQTSHHRQVLQPQHLQQLQEHHHHQAHLHQTHQPPSHHNHHSRHQRHYSATEPYTPTGVVPAAIQNIPIPSPIVTVGPVQLAAPSKVASPRLSHSSMTNPFLGSSDGALSSGGHLSAGGPLTEGPMNGSQGRRSRRNGPSAGPHYCKVCGHVAAYLCSGCQRAWYCSPRCQMTDWHTHNKNCEHGK